MSYLFPFIMVDVAGENNFWAGYGEISFGLNTIVFLRNDDYWAIAAPPMPDKHSMARRNSFMLAFSGMSTARR